jgi:hypothetical protein
VPSLQHLQVQVVHQGMAIHTWLGIALHVHPHPETRCLQLLLLLLL